VLTGALAVGLRSALDNVFLAIRARASGSQGRPDRRIGRPLLGRMLLLGKLDFGGHALLVRQLLFAAFLWVTHTFGVSRDVARQTSG
jgi:hypothetical protein